MILLSIWLVFVLPMSGIFMEIAIFLFYPVENMKSLKLII